jgi:chromosome segregation ATPase
LNFTDRIAGLDTNLEDLQAGIEATARAADTLQTDTTKFDGLLKVSLLRAVVRHVQELQACARDQRAALQELRDSISRLRQELKRSNGVVRPPPIIGADAVRR